MSEAMINIETASEDDEAMARFCHISLEELAAQREHLGDVEILCDNADISRPASTT